MSDRTSPVLIQASASGLAGIFGMHSAARLSAGHAIEFEHNPDAGGVNYFDQILHLPLHIPAKAAFDPLATDNFTPIPSGRAAETASRPHHPATAIA